jgi:DNA-binding HxlR family transcriptional regulator
VNLGRQGPAAVQRTARAAACGHPETATERLRKRERDGFLHRSYYREIPRVEYEITPLAETLIPALRVLADWSAAHLDEVHAARRRYDAEH